MSFMVGRIANPSRQAVGRIANPAYVESLPVRPGKISLAF